MISKFRRRLLINAAKNDKITYPGLIAAWSAKGKSNDDADRTVLRDLTGNGHDITLNNFAFSEMSGYGGYAIGKSNGWIEDPETKFEIYEFSYNRLHVRGANGVFSGLVKGIGAQNAIWESFKVKYTSNNPNIKIRFKYIDENDVIKIGEPLEEGVNTIPKSYGRVNGSEWISILAFEKYNVTEPDFECTIELIPEYPDALVFDGVDDYGINEDMPIQTDYTIIVKRKVIKYNTTKQCGVITKRTSSASLGAFWFERGGDTWSYGTQTNVEAINNDITWQNKTSYNGTPIASGSSSDTNIIHIGRNYIDGSYFIGIAFYSAYLFDRSLDEQEIKSFIRKYIDADYLLPSEIPTPDCYYDFTNGDNASETRETIVDLSGNGNDAKAYNFAWNEEGSGYKDGTLQFDGKDDYISLEAFDSGFKTMFMVCKPLKKDSILYDQRTEGGNNYNIYIDPDNPIAYISRNDNGTYINGQLNEKYKVNDLFNKKQLIHIVTKNTEQCIPIIGTYTAKLAYYANMSFYKFLGFKEELTEEQIQCVIKKYNLLDGVDEIEVN